MHFQFKKLLIPVLSFAAGAMATALVIDIQTSNRHAAKMARVQRVEQANLLGAEEALRVKRFLVSISEVNNTFVLGDTFEGDYQKTLTMSDGSKRTIHLTPLIHKDAHVVAFQDNGKRTYMGMNSTTTNGRLMVRLHALDD